MPSLIVLLGPLSQHFASCGLNNMWKTPLDGLSLASLPAHHDPERSTGSTNLPTSRPCSTGAAGHALQSSPMWYRASACQADNGTFSTGAGVLLRIAVFIIILTNEHHVILTCVPLHAQSSSNGEILLFVSRVRIFFLVELLSKIEKKILPVMGLWTTSSLPVFCVVLFWFCFFPFAFFFLRI